MIVTLPTNGVKIEVNTESDLRMLLSVMGVPVAPESLPSSQEMARNLMILSGVEQSERELGAYTLWFLQRLARVGAVTSAELMQKTNAENARSLGGIINKIRNDLGYRGYSPDEVFVTVQSGTASEYRRGPKAEEAYTRLAGASLPGMEARRQ